MKDADVLVGASEAMRNLREEIECAAHSDTSVLIGGENGAGKAAIARGIHAKSARTAAPMVTMKLTSASCQLGVGAVEAAAGGTLYLDGICAMNLRMQELLLRFLDSRIIRLAGSDFRRTRIDVRIIGSTHPRLIDRVRRQHFREDLYYRLNIVYLAVPAVRERRADIPALLDSAFSELAAQYERPQPFVEPDALAALMMHDWPGNLLELNDTAARLMASSGDGIVRVGDVASTLAYTSAVGRAADQGRRTSPRSLMPTRSMIV